MVPESYWQAMYEKVGASARRFMHAAMKRNPKMHWRSQDAGDASTIGCLLRKAVGTMKVTLERGARAAELGGRSYMCPLEPRQFHHKTQMLDMEPQDLAFPLLGFGFLWSDRRPPVPPFWNGNVCFAPPYIGNR